MAIVSIWGNTTPPGTWIFGTDGDPSIEVGNAFYSGAASRLRGRPCVGGKVYMPAGQLGKTVRIAARVAPVAVSGSGGAVDLSAQPTASKDVTIENNEPHWVTATWDSPFTFPTDTRLVAITHSFPGTPTAYVAGSGGRSTSDPTPSTVDPTALLYWSENNSPEYGGVLYRIGAGATNFGNALLSYGTDILIDDEAGANVPPVANAGADVSVTPGTPVTLSGSGSSDSDGTIVTYTWTQASGPTVTLSGTGATRTFTPTQVGTYVFGLTATDEDGATSPQDTVVVTVAAAASTGTVAAENALPGHGPQFWMEGVTSEALPAFARRTYYEPGQTVQLSVDKNVPFNVEIFRLGHYAGSGARRVQAAFAGTPEAQPAPATIPGGNGAVTCAAWSVNASWAVPADATPGWYYALLRTADNAQFGHVLFLVSDKQAKKPLLMVTGDATWHAAYNGYGGNNVYGASKGIGNIQGRALCSTYDKPVITRDYVPQTHFLNNSYPVLKFLERMGYEVAQASIEQIKDDPTILDGRQLIMWTGHNEYVPQNVVTKTKQLLTAGQNMVNIAGNDFFWRVKFTDGAFTSSADGRVMWCRKDTMSGPTSGPNAVSSHVGGQAFSTAADWTGTWQDTRWSLREPTDAYFGDRFIANGIRSDSVSVPASMKTSPAWRNCPAVQALAAGASYTFAPGTLGMEWDKPVSVAGGPTQVSFSSTTVNLVDNAADVNGENYDSDDLATHAFTMGRKGSGGLIANFNSDQWGWALDALHLRGTAPADPNAQQMMVNVIADLGVLPHGSSVTAASLTVPTPTPSPAVAYGLTATPDPEPEEPTDPEPGSTVRAALRAAGFDTVVTVRL